MIEIIIIVIMSIDASITRNDTIIYLRKEFIIIKL